MRRDSIFYKLFQQSPTLLFELLANPPENTASYRFDSVAVKEPKFEIDGVFLPPEADRGVVYFCEVQFQKDERLYERLFGESFLYFYRNRERFWDWRAVIIYPSRNIEQSNSHPYRSLISSDQVHRVYLSELGEIRQLPIGVALMVLTTLEEEASLTEAQHLLTRSHQESDPEASRAIIELVTTIIVYKFAQLSRSEVEAMLGLSLQETRVYQEAKEEGREEGTRSLILLLLTQRLGIIPNPLSEQISTLTLAQLEALAIALLNFSTLTDLETWLSQQNQ